MPFFFSFSHFLFGIVELSPDQLLGAGGPINFTVTAKSCQHTELENYEDWMKKTLTELKIIMMIININLP